MDAVDKIEQEKSCFRCKFLQTEYFNSSCGGYAKYHCLHIDHPKYLGTSIWHKCDDKELQED